MIIVVAVALVIVSVPLAGGHLGALSSLRVRAVWTVFVAIALQVVVISIMQAVLPHALASAVHLGSYGLAAWFVVVNRHIRGLFIVAAGGLLNLVAIALNHGVMPASAAAMRSAGIATASGEFVNSGAVAHPKLGYLGDIFALPKPWPFANVFSIGDVLVVIGVAVVLHSACRSRISGHRTVARVPSR